MWRGVRQGCILLLLQFARALEGREEVRIRDKNIAVFLFADDTALLAECIDQLRV